MSGVSMNKALSHLLKMSSLFFILTFAKTISAAELFLPDSPLSVGGGKTALVQLIMERDHALFFEAYPSYIDIDGDGELDTKYKPDDIDYYGYFDSNLCYANTGVLFYVVYAASDKKCAGTWSGDFLNYATMTRMDILRMALYGGKRMASGVSASGLVLRRAYVPIEKHTWGFEYTSPAVDGYSLPQYTPIPNPIGGRKYFFATNNVNHNYTTSNTAAAQVPYLSYKLSEPGARIWEWIDKERTQGDGPGATSLPVDVAVCLPIAAALGVIESFCKQYPDGSYKPVGLLQEFGENNAMYFSLLSGSYENNKQGGVLRQAMDSFGANEINPTTGEFTAHKGIVSTLDSIRIPDDWKDDGSDDKLVHNDCGWFKDHIINNGECRTYGNPVAEMMYEGLRYLGGKMTPTPEFETSGGMDAEVGLVSQPWDDPYDASKPYGECASAYQLVISEPGPSFDSDQLPGSDFGSFTGSTLDTLHVGNIADFITLHEPDVVGNKFIGESGTLDDKSPSAKPVTSLRDIRGIAPEAPYREGSYYASSVAYYGHQNDLHATAPGIQSVENLTVALGKSLPSLDVNVGGNVVSFAPLSKSVSFPSWGADTTFNEMIGFTVVEHTPTSGMFRVSFGDVPQGADNDMDAAAVYSYSVVGGQVEFKVESSYASGTAVQHMGFAVSGSTADGIYLVVRDSDTSEDDDVDDELDVPPGELPDGNWSDGTHLPLVSELTFTPNLTVDSASLESPLWYAAKWGGFNDINGDGIPQTIEWDANGDSVPDNYFPITNPSKVAETLRTVLGRITSDASGAASSVVSSAGSLKLSNKIYRAKFSSDGWTGDLVSQELSNEGEITDTVDWSANAALAQQILTGTRNIISYNPNSKRGVPFTWPANPLFPGANRISTQQILNLSRNPVNNALDLNGKKRLEYIRGVAHEGFRVRSSALGDIVRSSPVLVSSPSSQYPDDWGTGAPENAKPYSDFRALKHNRPRVVYAGANDGMLHAFDAGEFTGSAYSDGTGEELFAYVPSPVFKNLPDLTDPNYGHKHYVDSTPRASDVFIDGEWRTVLVGGLGKGGQGIYALDITNPDTITEANADNAVLWEFTDKEYANLGYTYHTPLIARMANGKWNVIIANGYNSTEVGVGSRRGNGTASILVIDMETGNLTRELKSNDAACAGNIASPNAMAPPTAIDTDGDKIVDTIYAGDLNGCVYYFDVTNSNPNTWKKGKVKHRALDLAGNPAPITTTIAIGTNPTGDGVMLYFGTGKYLEPVDQLPKTSVQRIYGIYDRAPNDNTAAKTAIAAGNMLQQTITSELPRAIDTSGDGVNDSAVDVRETSQEDIDWDLHEGWYMDLAFGSPRGEQVIASPVLREGKIIFVTHIAEGGQCTPGAAGWLMVLDARNGAMLDDPSLDLNGDGEMNDGVASGVANQINPYASPTVVTGDDIDYLLTQNETGTEASAIGMATVMNDGQLTWREVQP